MSAESASPPDPPRTPKGAFAHTADPDYAHRRDELKDRIPTAMAVISRYAGWTHREIGTIMGLSAAAVKHRMYGRTEFTAAELIALAERLCIPLPAFYDPQFPFEEVLRRRRPDA